MAKQLWILTGGNGAGKSTFYKQRLEGLNYPFINADLIAKEFFPESPEKNSLIAAKLAEAQRYRHIDKGLNFCYETVFSHPSKIDFLGDAKARGYSINLVFVHLNNTDLNKQRVIQRHLEGGHNVPLDKIESRIPKTLKNVKTALPLCDFVLFLDNSSKTDPFRQLATIRQGVINRFHKDELAWLDEMLGA